MLPHAKSFRDLHVYQKAVALEQEIFRSSRIFPADERYSLTDQIQRSVRSVGAQIAEAWAKRRYPAHFASKLSDADAEQMETQHWVGAAVRAGYWTQKEEKVFLGALEEIGRMLGAMIRQADQFCGTSSTSREEPAIYSCDPPSEHFSPMTDY